MNDKHFSNFQLRWKEPLGRPECPYLYRYVIVFFGYSIRLHHWIRSDDKRHFHDHPMNFFSILLKGSYTDVTPEGRQTLHAPAWLYTKAPKKHYVDVPKGGAWTLLFCSRNYRKWGMYVKNHLWRPLRYFSKFNHPPCDVQ